MTDFPTYYSIQDMNRYDQIKAVVADRIPFDYFRVVEEPIMGRAYTNIELYDAYGNLVRCSWWYAGFDRCISALRAELNAVYS